MTALLASVRTSEEAATAIAGGADIIDLKEPAAGALGRLPDATIRAILDVVARRCVTSATIGDMPLAPHSVHAAVHSMAATGVDIVKLGFFTGDGTATLRTLARATRRGLRLVGVFFADRRPDFTLLDRCAGAGFYGVMVDTADKTAGPVSRHMSLAELACFIDRARRHRLLVGLAGSLRIEDVPALMSLAPDFLGFRSALATGGRDGPLNGDAVVRLRVALDAAAPMSLGRSLQVLHSRATAAAGAQSAAIAAASSGAATNSAKLR